METNKTSESVKAGLQVEADHKPVINSSEDAAKETDADEMVHEQQADIDIADTSEEKDLDELVHRMPAATTADNNNETDPDDLVHQK